MNDLAPDNIEVEDGPGPGAVTLRHNGELIAHRPGRHKGWSFANSYQSHFSAADLVAIALVATRGSMSGRTPAEWREYGVYWVANPETREVRRYAFVDADCLITCERPMLSLACDDPKSVRGVDVAVVRVRGIDSWREYINLPWPWRYLEAA